MRFYPGLFAAVNEGKRSIELDLKDAAGRARALELATQADVLVEGFRPGVLARLGLGRGGRAGAQPRHRLLLHLRLRPTRPSCRAARPRRELPGVVGRLDARGRHGDDGPPAPDRRPGRRADGRLRDLRRRAGPDHQRRGHLPRRLHDRRAGDLDRSRRCRDRQAGRRPIPRPHRCPATASSRRPTAGRWRSAWSTSSTSGRICARSSASARWPPSASTSVARRGAELQQAVGGAVARQPRDGLVARLVAAGVPVAPVLDREGMLATTPFPGFPIRLPLPEVARPVPTLDQHRGQGFAEPG